MKYDDGDPYSCMAAGWAETNARRWPPERVARFRAQVESCFGKPEDSLRRLLDEDRPQVILILRKIQTGSRSQDKARWAAQQLSRLGITPAPQAE